ncbi:MAG: hypothetical protein Q9212_000626 [Teloschistes hypoglaucus]
MGDSSKITISADGHYRSTGELPSEKPFDLSDANASKPTGENHLIHKSIERDFVNDEKGQATAPQSAASDDQAGVQTPKTDSKGKATDHGESQAAGQTGENTAAEAGGEKSKKKRSRRRKPKKPNAATQQEDEGPSSPVTPASVRPTTPASASKPSGHAPPSAFTYSSGLPTSATPQTSTDETKPARLFSIPVAPAMDPELERFLRGPLPPAKSPFPYGPHGWISTSNDGSKGLLPSGAGGSIPPAAPSTGAGAGAGAGAAWCGAGGSIPPAAPPTAALPTDQVPAETSTPPQVQQRKIHRIRRLEIRKANAGNAEPAASNVWDTEGSSSGLGGSIPPAAPPSGAADLPPSRVAVSSSVISEDVDRLKKDCEKFAQKLKAAEKEIDGLNSTVRERDAEILEHEKTINQTASNVRKLEDSRDKYEEEFEDYRKEIKDLKDQRRAAEAECKRLGGVISGQDAQIRDQDTEISNLKQRIKQQDGLGATIKGLEGQIKDLETELQQARTFPTAVEPRDPDHSSEKIQKLEDEHQKQIQALRDEHAKGKAFDTQHLEKECTLHERALRMLEEDVEDLRTRCGSLELANKDYLGQIDEMKVALEERADANPGPSNTSPAASQAGNDLEGIADQSHADDPASDEDDFSDSGDQPSLRSRQARRAGDRRGSSSDELSPLSFHRFEKGPQQAMTSVGTQTDAEATTTTDDKPGPMQVGPITTIDEIEPIKPIEPIKGAPPTTTVVPIKKSGWNFGWGWWCCLAVILVVVAWLAVRGSSARRELDMWAQANHHVSRRTLSSLRGGGGQGWMGWLWGDGVAEDGRYY